MNVESILNLTPEEMRTYNREKLRELLEPLIGPSRKPDEAAEAAKTQKNLLAQITALRKLTNMQNQ